MPGESQPEAAIAVLFTHQIDGSDDLARIVFEAEGPDPDVAARDGGEGDVAVIGERGVGGIGPGNGAREVADNVPVREEELGLGRVFEGKGLEQQPDGFEGRGHLFLCGARYLPPFRSDNANNLARAKGSDCGCRSFS